MRAYIKKIQAKEEDARKRILVGTLIVSMFLVGSVWVYGLTDRFGKKEVAIADETSVKPFALFKDSISNLYQDVTASVGNISFAPKSEQKQVDLIVVDNVSTQ